MYFKNIINLMSSVVKYSLGNAKRYKYILTKYYKVSLNIENALKSYFRLGENQAVLLSSQFVRVSSAIVAIITCCSGGFNTVWASIPTIFELLFLEHRF